MNTSTIARPTNTTWLRHSIAVVGTLLISGIVALGLAAQLYSAAGPAAARAASISAGRARFAALKDRQAEARDTTFVPALARPTGRARFAALKDRQAEARDTTVVPAPAQPPAWHAGRARFAALKDRQAEARDTTVVPTTGWARVVEWFAALQAWARSLGIIKE